MTPTQQTSQHLTSLFETDDATCPLSNVTNENDGRGYTCGWAGFTTADGEPGEVIRAYGSGLGLVDFDRFQKVGNQIDSIVSALERLAKEGSDSTNRLDELSFKTYWHAASLTDNFKAAYATIVDRIFGVPAQTHCDKLGLKLPISYAALFDAGIQHGWGDDPDGVPAMIERTKREHFPPASYGGYVADYRERVFLKALLNERSVTLEHPYNRETADEWRASLPRVEALRHLLDTNPLLTPPVRVVCADWDVEIETL